MNTLVIGSLIRPELHEQVWSTGLLELPPAVTMERIARREESRVEKISGLRSVRGRRDAFLMEIRPRTLGIRSPAVRQEAARWATSAADGNTGAMSEYLAAAVRSSAHIVHAVDLAETSDVRGVRRYLEDHSLVPNDVVARVELPQLLASLHGVSFFATINKTTNAKIVLSFGENPTTSAKEIASIFRHIVDDMHMSLEELESADVTASSTTITLTMELSDESLRRVLSLITSPSPPHGANDETISSEPIPHHEEIVKLDDELAASRRYYQSVSHAIDDLARVNRKAPSTLGRRPGTTTSLAREITCQPRVSNVGCSGSGGGPVTGFEPWQHHCEARAYRSMLTSRLWSTVLTTRRVGYQPVIGVSSVMESRL